MTSISRNNSAIPKRAYVQVVLPDLAKTGGPGEERPFRPVRHDLEDPATASNERTTVFLQALEPGPSKRSWCNFHIDRMQRHIQSLGFDNVLNHAIPVNIDGTTEDNSFYSPIEKSLTFGTGRRRRCRGCRNHPS